jgi:hypothetical protein
MGTPYRPHGPRIQWIVWGERSATDHIQAAPISLAAGSARRSGGSRRALSVCLLDFCVRRIFSLQKRVCPLARRPRHFYVELRRTCFYHFSGGKFTADRLHSRRSWTYCSFNWSVLQTGSGRTPSVHTSRWRLDRQKTAIHQRSSEAALLPSKSWGPFFRSPNPLIVKGIQNLRLDKLLGR